MYFDVHTLLNHVNNHINYTMKILEHVLQTKLLFQLT